MDISRIKSRYGIVGNDESLNHALRTALQVAPTDVSVLIHGESGTGKEAFSKIIHANSKRKHRSLIAVNCGAIPEGTIDSELFGHEKGSFTGAYESRKGYFEVVDRGTIFLDEIAEMPLATQARLLRVLEAGEFIRVGSSRVQKVDVRIIAATNVDALHAIRQGKFRQDLYYRLNTVPIYVPPLRHRKEDIGLLFAKFTSDFAERYSSLDPTLTPEAEALLQKARFPGNIRQLKNLAEQISLLEKQSPITEEILSRYLPKSESLPMVIEEKKHIPSQEQVYNILLRLDREVITLKRLLGGFLARYEEGKKLLAEHTHLFPPTQAPDVVSHIEVLSSDTLEKDSVKKAASVEKAEVQIH